MRIIVFPTYADTIKIPEVELKDRDDVDALIKALTDLRDLIFPQEKKSK